MHLLECFSLIVVICIAGVQSGSYLITAPSALQPGSMYDVSVDILNTTGVNVEVSLQAWTYNGTIRDYDVNVIDSVSSVFGQDHPGTLSIPVLATTRCPGCRLKVRGRGSLQFEHTVALALSNDVVVVFIQTDKAIYKPGQIVRYRAFAVYPNLQMYTGDLNVEIRDPNNNKILVQRRLTAGDYGVIEGSLELSEQPMFGDWSIQVDAEDTSDFHTQSFTVANYELPRFEITVELPPFGLSSDGSLSGKVKAKYTFGEDVKGLVELHVGRDAVPDQCGNGPKTTQISFDIDGTATFQIPKDDIQRAVPIYEGTLVKVTAFVTEATTGVRLNGSSVITYYNKDSSLKFLDNTPGVFKPGLPYTAYIQATTPDGKSPPTGSDNRLSVYTSVKYELTLPDQALYQEHRFEGTFPLPGQNLTLPTNGIAPVSIDIPENATSITIQATFRGVVASKTVEKTWSQSNNFLRLTLLEKNIKAGSQVPIKIEGTEPMGIVNYEVIARGGKVWAHHVNASSSKSVTFNLQVTPNMAPVAHVLAYYNRGGDEIVADSLAFDVDGLFYNPVTVGLSRNESEPNEQVQVHLTADPMSRVNVLAVDQSVLLLKSGNDITPEKVSKEVSKFDRSSQKPSSPEFALSYSSSDMRNVFENTGLMVISDVEMEEPIDIITFVNPVDPITTRIGGNLNKRPESTPDQSDGFDSLQEVERIRNIFPETWLWKDVETRSDGTAVLSTTVPDTITSWVVSAFATNPSTGLGVAPTTSKLKVFRPFFISLSYPGIVKRGEHIVVQATIFNYLEADQLVVVKLKGNNQFNNIYVDPSGSESYSAGERTQNINVVSGEQGVVYFPIVASNIGLLTIEVTAQSTMAADGVSRFITVEPEGAPVSYNTPLFINIDNGIFAENLTFTLPAASVAGSESAKVKVTGDMVGFVDTMLDLPTGCGEQSMVKMAPNLYIGKYLKSSGQLTTAEEERIVHALETGYQRQLTYQRYDGSFSAFGNSDPSGSSWLTALVAGTFAEARDFIYVDPNVIAKAVDWLVDRQHQDGRFADFGKVLDPNTQTARTAEGLTAYVVTALLKTSDLAGNPRQQELWTNSSRRAVQILERKVSDYAVADPLSLAMVSYALTLAGSPKSSLALYQLSNLNTTQGGLVYWGDGTTTSSSSAASLYTIWRPPVVQARPVSILTTSYAILAMTAAGNIEEAFPSVQWLTAQRNPQGGFASSQDTSVGLQALAAYSTASTRPDTDLLITVNTDSMFTNVRVNVSNALALQVLPMSDLPAEAEITAQGSGFALLEMIYSFNVKDELSTPSFDVSTVLLDDDLDSFNLMVCTKWLWDRDTGMVVQEISIPSGFEPDLTTLGDVAGLERSERKGNTVAVYFDKISKSSLCYSLVMTRTAKVAQSQMSFVRTFDYYQPSDQSTVFYHPRKLKESTICDVCDGCCL